MNSEAKWYALHTRQRWEKKVALLLHKAMVEHYCPLNKVLRQWSDRKKTVLEPLFTSYVFVRIKEEDIGMAKQLEGVINVVYWMGKPAVIKNEEIDAIREFLAEHPSVHVAHEKVNVNDTVRITTGAFTNLEGSVTEVQHHSVKVMLPSLGYSMTARMSLSQVENIMMLQQPQKETKQ